MTKSKKSDLTKDERPIVVGIGEALLDYYDGTKKLGGAPLIFAYHAAKTHCRGVIVSAIGATEKDNPDNNGKILIPDNNGRRIIKGLKRNNLWEESKDFIYKVKNRKTGTVDVRNPGKDPQYDIMEDAAWVDIPCPDISDKSDKLIALAKKTTAVYFGSLASICAESQKGSSKQAIDTFIDKIDELANEDSKKRYKIFDVNLRELKDERAKKAKPSIIKNYIERCNVLKTNKEELDYLCELYGIDEKDIDGIGKELMKRCNNIEILILTRREKGSTVFWRDDKDGKDEKMVFSQSIHISVEPEHIVGAGDAMVGAFIGELLTGSTVSKAHLLAAQRADKICKDTEHNSMPNIPGKDFFFSYSKKDTVIANLFYHKFNNNGYSVFKDNPELLPGTNIWNDIFDAIDNCKVFVYFSSEYANVSPWVLKEINEAIGRKEIAIIMLDNTPFHETVSKYLEPIYHERFNLYNKLREPKYDMVKELDNVSYRIMKFYKHRTR